MKGSMSLFNPSGMTCRPILSDEDDATPAGATVFKDTECREHYSCILMTS
jgi:hypothetical protein